MNYYIVETDKKQIVREFVPVNQSKAWDIKQGGLRRNSRLLCLRCIAWWGSALFCFMRKRQSGKIRLPTDQKIRMDLKGEAAWMISRKNEADNCRGWAFFWRWRLFSLFRCLSKTGIQEPAGWAMSMCSIMKRAAKKSIKAAPVTSTCRESPIWWSGTTSTFMASFRSVEPCLPTERSTYSAMFALLYPFWTAYIFRQSMHFSLDI